MGMAKEQCLLIGICLWGHKQRDRCCVLIIAHREPSAETHPYPSQEGNLTCASLTHPTTLRWSTSLCLRHKEVEDIFISHFSYSPSLLLAVERAG